MESRVALLKAFSITFNKELEGSLADGGKG